MSVSALVMEFGGDEDQAIAGLLHDTLEDCGPEHEKVIRNNWGPRVATIVLDCTDGTPDGQGKKADWHARKRKYIEHLQTINSDSLLVSACDKLHNARAIAADLRAGHDVFARFSAGREDTLWYYQSILQIFDFRFEKSEPILAELMLSIRNITEAAAQRA